MKRNRGFAWLLAVALTVVMAFGGVCVASAETEAKDVTLSLVSYRALQSDPVQWYETDVYKHILDRVAEEYGWRISFDYEQYDEDKLNLMFASAELPDIVYFYSANQARTVLENDFALDLWPLMEQYAPHMLDPQFAQRNELMRTLAGGEEQGLYFVPTTYGLELSQGGVDCIRGYAVRWDWYKEIGAPEILDDATYADALAKMVEAHPTTDDGKTSYAFGYSDNFGNWTQMRGAFTKESFVNPWTVSGYLYAEGLDDNTLYNGYTNTERSTYWQEMRFANKLYGMGLLDPDSFTQTNAEYNTKAAAGQYAGLITAGTGLYAEASKADPNTTAGYIVVPSEGELFFANKIHLAGYFPDQQVFVSSDSKNWEASLALIDFLHTDEAQRALYSGIEGVHWNYNADGVPQLTAEAQALLANGGEALQRAGIKVTSAIRISQPAVLAADGYPLGLTETDEMRVSTMNSVQRDYSEFYGVAYPSLARQALVDAGKTIDHSHNFSQLVAVAREALPTDVVRILTKCNDILYRAIPELVMAEDTAAFEAVQERVLGELESVDEPTAWEWVSQAQAAAHAVVDPIVWGE